jgi:carbonic anhydrase
MSSVLAVHPRRGPSTEELTSMQELVKGIHRLSPGHFRSAQRLFQLHARGGRPRALLITCSDMPQDSNCLIPANFAHTYVLQNFGNLAEPFDPLHPEHVSSVEAALALYRVDDIVVCGHAPCDVMTNLFLADAADDAAIPRAATALVSARRTRRIMVERYRHLEGPRFLMAAVEENVLVQLENVRTVPLVASRLARGDLYLHGWIYASGSIFIYEPDREQFTPLNQ